MFQSGFPFDDSDFDRDRDYNFQSELDDIAKRHPEFAEHLTFGGSSPFRSQRNRQRRGSDIPADSPQQSSSFNEHPEFRRRPFPSRFQEFGFPEFGRYFNAEPDFYREAEPAEYQPQEQVHPQPEVQKTTQTEATQTEPITKPPQAPQSERGRKQNIQQSNTVDLGQKQDPLTENRSQRSMSAPPENRTGAQRYVSSINIPIQRDAGIGDMGARSSSQQQDLPSQPPSTQGQQPKKPTERVIPIHVEGRDEPVIPKNVNQSYTQPEPEQIFGHKPSHFNQFVNRGGEPHIPPEDMYRQQQQQYQKQQQQNFQQQKEKTPPAQQPEQSHSKSPPPKPTPLDIIQAIQKDVLELMSQVENFKGKPKDKQYLYLDEMLTRNLIKLDNIETEGKDNIRQARKEAIKCIEKCISILEAKANANKAAAETKMEVEQKETAAEKETPVTEQNQEPEQPVALQVSGVVRSGSVVQPESEAASMEVTVADSTTEVIQEEKSSSEPKTEVEKPASSKPAETCAPESTEQKEQVGAEPAPMEVEKLQQPEASNELVETSQDTPDEKPGDEKKEAKKEKKKGKKEKTDK